MHHRWALFRGIFVGHPVIAGALLLLTTSVAAAMPLLELKPGDRICLIGNTLAERMQLYPHWELLLYARFPQHDLTVRNLAWSADELELRPRSLNFGSPDKYLEKHRADVVLACFGLNESYQGQAGIEPFRGQLRTFIRHTRNQKYNGTSAPRLVLISPIAYEADGRLDLPDGNRLNAQIESYVEAMREVAAAEQIPFVDLFHPTRQLLDESGSLTFNGIHLTDEGYRRVAPLLDEGLFGSRQEPSPDLLQRLQPEVAAKNLWFWHDYRAVNGYYIYGGRADLHDNRAVLEAERKKLDQMAEVHDRRIWQVARGESLTSAADYRDTDTLPVVPTNYTLPINYLPPSEAKQKFQLAAGYAIDCFASEEDFPELANPVAIKFDARGRLWVCVMPTYPQFRPPDLPHDKILILEDRDGDGHADHRTVFADGLHVPTGFELGDGGVYVAQQPNLLFLRDTDGDDRADQREVILHGFDSADSHHSISAFTWDPGGGLSFQEGTFHHSQIETPYGPVRCKDAGIFRFDPRMYRTEVFVSYPFANPWGHVVDSWGQNFVADASGGANYYGTAFSGDLDYPRKHREMQQMIRMRVRPTAGNELVSSRHFPESAQGRLLLTNCIGVLGVLQHDVREIDSGFVGEEVEPLVLSSDPNFRPVDLLFGFDGALYVCDWHNALIGHMQHSVRDPNRDQTHGRIWRITYPSRALLQRPEIEGASLAGLLELLRQPEARTRYAVRRELHGRNTTAVMAALSPWLAHLAPGDPERERLRLEALWIRQAHHQPNRAFLQQVLASPEPRARAAATRVLCAWRDEIERPLELLATMARDPHPRVRLEACRAASFLRSPESVRVALAILPQPRDGYLDYVLQETLETLRPQWEHDPSLLTEDSPASDYLLARISPEKLRSLPDAPPVLRARLASKGLEIDQRLSALRRLADTEQRDVLDVWCDQASQAFRAASIDTDETMKFWTELLGQLTRDEQRAGRARALQLAREGSTDSIRTLGYTASLTIDGKLEDIWTASEHDQSSFAAMLRGLAYVEPRLRKEAGQRIARLLKPADGGDTASGSPHLLDQDSVRNATLGTIAQLGLPAPSVIEILVPFLSDPQWHASAVTSLRQLDPQTLSAELATACLAPLADYWKGLSLEARATEGFPDDLAFAKKLVEQLPDEQRATWQTSLDSVAIQRIRVASVPQRMAFDSPVIVVEAGRPVELIFSNPDEMPHNLAVGTPGSLPTIGLAADALAADPQGPAKGYLPQVPEILAATPMLEPRQSARIILPLPDAEGSYPFVCTYPGHWRRMYGALLAVKQRDDYVAQQPQLPTAESLLGLATTVHAWSDAELLPRLSDVTHGEVSDLGPQVFAKGSCSACHRMNGHGGVIGPDLSDVATRLKPQEILRELLHPSQVIDDKFKPLIAVTLDGKIVRGSVVKETQSEVHLVENPLVECEPTVLRRDEIDWQETVRSETSPMPDGLLNTLTEDEVVALLAYLLHGGSASGSGAAP